MADTVRLKRVASLGIKYGELLKNNVMCHKFARLYTNCTWTAFLSLLDINMKGGVFIYLTLSSLSNKCVQFDR